MSEHLLRRVENIKIQASAQGDINARNFFEDCGEIIVTLADISNTTHDELKALMKKLVDMGRFLDENTKRLGRKYPDDPAIWLGLTIFFDSGKKDVNSKLYGVKY